MQEHSNKQNIYIPHVFVSISMDSKALVSRKLASFLVESILVLVESTELSWCAVVALIPSYIL